MRKLLRKIRELFSLDCLECGGWGVLLGISTAQLIGNYPLALDILSIIVLVLILIADIKATINSEKESK